MKITKVPWVGCKRPCSKEPSIDSQEGEQRKSHMLDEVLDEVFILAMNDVYFLCLRQHVT